MPDPTTFCRWLRRAGGVLVPRLDQLLRRLVQWRCERGGLVERLTLVLDSTVVVGHVWKYAGVELGYNPKKPARPSHNPLLAFAVETGDLIGLL